MGLQWGPHTPLPKSYAASSDYDMVFGKITRTSGALLQINRDLETLPREKWNLEPKLKVLYAELDQLTHTLHNSREISIGFHDMCARLRDNAHAMCAHPANMMVNDFDLYFTFVKNYNIFVDSLRPIMAKAKKPLPNNDIARPNPPHRLH
jgi:hypothetical protein